MYGSVIGWRFFVTTSLLFLAIGFRWYFGDAPKSPGHSALFVFVGTEYSLTVLYLLLGRWRRWRNSERVLAGQLLFDLLLVAIVLIYTGGLYSNFWVLYSFVAIVAVALLSTQLSIPVMALTISVPIGMALLHWFTGYRISSHSPDVLRDLVVRTSYNTIFLFVGSVAGQFLGERVRKTSRALQKSERDIHFLQRMNNIIVENIPSGLLVLNGSGNLLTSNLAANQILGRRQEQAMQLFDQGTYRERNELILKGDLEDTVIGYTSVPTSLPDNTDGTIVLFQDLTQHKQLEEQVRRQGKLSAIGRLGANLAHEIRNPLAGISNAFELLQEHIEGVSEDPMSRIINREMDRLQTLLNSFLTYTSPAKETPEMYTPCTLARDIINTGYHDAELRCNPDENWSVFGQAALFVQSLHNLLRNARQWADPDHPIIRCTLRKLKTGLELIVEDNGPGIAPEHRDKIWEPFQSGYPEGSGLGLAIVASHMAETGGTSHVGDSQDLGGARFRLFFPAGNHSDALIQ